MFSKSSSRLPMIWSASDQPLALTLVRIPFLLKQGTTVEISSERNFRKGRVDWHVAHERNLEKKRLIFVRFLSVSQSGKNRPARDRIPGQNTHTHTSFISLTLKYVLRMQDKEINKGCIPPSFTFPAEGTPKVVRRYFFTTTTRIPRLRHRAWIWTCFLNWMHPH